MSSLVEDLLLAKDGENPAITFARELAVKKLTLAEVVAMRAEVTAARDGGQREVDGTQHAVRVLKQAEATAILLPVGF